MIENRESEIQNPLDGRLIFELRCFAISSFPWPPLAKPPRFRAPSAAHSRAGSGAWVTIREAFWIALEALRAHKLRSFLTLLGVVIATTTLIVVMSIINGMNLYIADHIANLGANVFIVHQFQWAQGYEAWLKARRRNKPIRIEEFEFLRDNLKDYKNIGAEADMQNDNTYVTLPKSLRLRRGNRRRNAQHDRHRSSRRWRAAGTSPNPITSTNPWCASSGRTWWMRSSPTSIP